MRKTWLPRIIFTSGALVVAFVVSLAVLMIYRPLMIERLAAVADLAAITTEPLLQAGEMPRVEEQLGQLTRSYGLAGIELHSSDGRSLAAFGVEKRRLPQAIAVGEYTSLSWPGLIHFQYAKILFQQQRPFGVLVVHSSIRPVVLAVACLPVLLVILLLVFLWREVVRLHARNTRKKGARPLRDGLSADEKEQSADDDANNLMEELRRERDQAQRAARTKGDFLANASHEIRTSLNGIIGVLSLLEKSGIRDEKMRLVRTAMSSADSLLLIVNDILDFAKIESGKLVFERVPFDIREIVERSIALYSGVGISRQVNVHCYVPQDVETKVMGDPTRLYQVITNLLSNAIKFTHEGEVNLWVQQIETSENSETWNFTVEDSGVGIDPDKLDVVFGGYVQAEAKTMRKYGGTGLGLAICKHLVELQNGAIGVDNNQNGGATFWFTLEFDKAAERGATSVVEVPPGVKIVIVEKCETCRTILAQYLQGTDIRWCVEEKDVVEMLTGLGGERDVPDILLLDYRSVAGGLEKFLVEMEYLFGGNGPKVFVLVGDDDTEKLEGGRKIAGIIHKPIVLGQLREELSGNARKTKEPERRRSGGGMFGGHVLLVDDEQLNRYVGKSILEKLGCSVDTVDDGAEAVDKVFENDYDLVLMDVQMPGMSGIEAVQEIRSREGEQGMDTQPIVALTANGLQSVRSRCLQAGMDGVVVKPIKPETLRKDLSPWLLEDRMSIVNGTEKEPAATVTEEDYGDSRVLWDRKLALEYLGGDEELLMDLVRLFLQRKETLLANLEEAWESGDGDAIGCAAHALKGAVNHFAAERCRRLAQSVEQRGAAGALDELAKELALLKDELESLEREFRRMFRNI